MSQPTAQDYNFILRVITSGRVIPFLGAGVNLCDRPQGARWAQPHDAYLPSGGELAEHLAEYFYYPGDDRRDLLRTSQYAVVKMGWASLYDSLREVFDEDYPPTSVHRFWATLPALLREKGYPADYPLIVTTNYDDLMERAMQEAGQPYDVVAYVAEGEQRGKFVHWPATGEAPMVIDVPNKYKGLALDQRPVVFKIHGAVDRRLSGDWDSYVITEDHYIDYLARLNPAELIPATLLAKLKTSHFLFLGYSLGDWNLRVFLHRLWGAGKIKRKSWAVQLDPETIEQQCWGQRGVDILGVPLAVFLEALRQRVQALEQKESAS